MAWETKQLPAEPDVVAPDGSFVRVLLGLDGGSMAHFELPAGNTSVAVVHQTLEEIWFFLGGEGEMWRSGGDEDAVAVGAGTCITIPKRHPVPVPRARAPAARPPSRSRCRRGPGSEKASPPRWTVPGADRHGRAADGSV